MDTLTVLGAALGIAVLLVMALTPLLLALPERARRRPRRARSARAPRLTAAHTS